DPRIAEAIACGRLRGYTATVDPVTSGAILVVELLTGDLPLGPGGVPTSSADERHTEDDDAQGGGERRSHCRARGSTRRGGGTSSRRLRPTATGNWGVSRPNAAGSTRPPNGPREPAPPRRRVARRDRSRPAACRRNPAWGSTRCRHRARWGRRARAAALEAV